MVADAARTLARAYEENGQVLPEVSEPARSRAGIELFVQVPERGSLSSRFANDVVRSHLKEFKGKGPTRPTVTVLGEVVESGTVCDCRKPSFYALFTHFLTVEPPVRCGDCWGTVPLYRLPLPKATPPLTADYRDILHWQYVYRRCDWLYMASGVGERFGQRQMEGVHSPLSKLGRGVAESLEDRVKRPVYYFLNRTAETKTERRRRCPSCGGAWLLRKPLHGIFDFRCRACRLVSNIAWGMR